MAGLQPHAVADLERPRGDQHDARDQVAQRLLGGEAEDDRDDRAGHGERPRLEPGDVQRDQHGRDQEREPDDEADGAGRRGIHPPEQRGRQRAPDVAREAPAEDHQRDRRDDAHGHVDPQHLLAVVVQQRGSRRSAGSPRPARSGRATPAAPPGRSAHGPARRAARSGSSVEAFEASLSPTLPRFPVSRRNRVCDHTPAASGSSEQRLLPHLLPRRRPRRLRPPRMPTRCLNRSGYGFSRVPGSPAARSIRRRSGSATYARPRAYSCS